MNTDETAADGKTKLKLLSLLVVFLFFVFASKACALDRHTRGLKYSPLMSVEGLVGQTISPDDMSLLLGLPEHTLTGGEQPKILIAKFVDCTFKPGALSQLVKTGQLGVLALTGCHLNKKLLEELEEAKSLYSLSVCKDSLTDNDFLLLSKLPNIIDLDFEGTQISGNCLELLPSQEKLQGLCLAHTSFDEQHLPVLRRFVKLTKLDFGSHGSISGAAFLRNGCNAWFPRLKLLNANFLNGTDEWLISISNIPTLIRLGTSPYLFLGGSELSDKLFTEIKDDCCPYLRSICLEQSKISPRAFAAFCHFSNLTEIRLRMCRLSGEELKPLTCLKNLRSLDLSENPLSSTGIRQVGSLRSLKELYMARCLPKSTGEELSGLVDSGIEHLDLGVNQLTQSDFTTLQKLHDLKELDIGGIQISPWMIEELKQCKNLRSLSLLGSKGLTPQTLISITGLVQLKELRVRFSDISAKDERWLKKQMTGCHVIGNH